MKRLLLLAGTLLGICAGNVAHANLSKNNIYWVTASQSFAPYRWGDVKAYCRNPSDIVVTGGCSVSGSGGVDGHFPQPNGGAAADFYACSGGIGGEWVTVTATAVCSTGQ
jgi:hypothetical protein